MTEEEESVLDEKLIECYNQKGITFKDESLYCNSKITSNFKSHNEMPILEDLYNVLLNDEKSKKFAIKLKPYVFGSLSFLNNHTNVNLESNIILVDIYDLGKENIAIGMFIAIELFFGKIKKERNKEKIIYLDEVWKLLRRIF